MRQLIVLAVLVLPGLSGQELQIRSELQRVGPDGEVIAVDRVERPREILSPAVARNAFASYILTARIPAGVKWQLEIGQNPENSVRVVLYRVGFDKEGLPDGLEKVELPIHGASTTADTVATYWLDLWVDGTAPVRRIKVEPQLWIGDRWVVYPMEARIQAVTVPKVEPRFWSQRDAATRSDAVMISPWRDLLCRQLPARFEPKVPTIRLLQHRNVLQDVALARKLGSAVRLQALQAGGVPPELNTIEAWCAAPVEDWQANLPVEWYLKVRDFLYRNALN